MSTRGAASLTLPNSNSASKGTRSAIVFASKPPNTTQTDTTQSFSMEPMDRGAASRTRKGPQSDALMAEESQFEPYHTPLPDREKLSSVSNEEHSDHV